ncbi:hypothetical protein CEXT_606831 [Caerostris extrusa]|uniref:Uncharacterized protein n=1 Tax=Caerostris extrusa TaxID=172846 RepID=A0AAV4NT56_CAEEX|nr:hypothetical protein CEXT_606831 [Caerostris extrusa]
MINVNEEKPPYLSAENTFRSKLKISLQLLDQQHWTDGKLLPMSMPSPLGQTSECITANQSSSYRKVHFSLCNVSFSAESFTLFQLRSADVCKKVGIWKKYRSSIQSEDPCAINQHGGPETLNHVIGLYVEFYISYLSTVGLSD